MIVAHFYLFFIAKEICIVNYTNVYCLTSINVGDITTTLPYHTHKSFLVSFLSLLSTFMCRNLNKVWRKSNKTCKLLSQTKKLQDDAILQHNEMQHALSASSSQRNVLQLDDAVLNTITRSVPTPTPKGPLARFTRS